MLRQKKEREIKRQEQKKNREQTRKGRIKTSDKDNTIKSIAITIKEHRKYDAP